MDKRVLLTTEGTYPYVLGGVSTWCDLLVKGLPNVHWQLLPITAGDEEAALLFDLPPNVSWAGHVELWSPQPTGRLRARGRLAGNRAPLPRRLVRLLSWTPDLDDITDALITCRTEPWRLDVEFGTAAGWDAFLDGLGEVLAESHRGAAPAPAVDVQRAVSLYQTLYWLARTAATPTPETDVLHVTAAGWAGIPAMVHKALHGTPSVLTEHGVYVREAYLAAVRNDPSPAQRLIDTRLARSLALLAYRTADVVVPVTGAHRPWEDHLTAGAATVLPIPNGVTSPATPVEPPGRRRVVSIGRLDPLKDVATMLRVAATVCRRDPEAEFLHYGPVPADQQAYARACYELHDELGLGDRFRFMGATRDPRAALQAADVVILTSISEGFPMAVLEAMSEARPVVATAVGGVAEALEGCGLVVPPGRVHDLALAVGTLLDQPQLARELGRRGLDRVRSRYDLDAVLGAYDELFDRLIPGRAAAGDGEQPAPAATERRVAA